MTSKFVRGLIGAVGGLGDALTTQAAANRERALLELERSWQVQDQAAEREFQGGVLVGDFESGGEIRGYNRRGETFKLGDADVEFSPPEKVTYNEGDQEVTIFYDKDGNEVRRSTAPRWQPGSGREDDPYRDALVPYVNDQGETVLGTREEAHGHKQPPSGGASEGDLSAADQRKLNAIKGIYTDPLTREIDWTGIINHFRMAGDTDMVEALTGGGSGISANDARRQAEDEADSKTGLFTLSSDVDGVPRDQWVDQRTREIMFPNSAGQSREAGPLETGTNEVLGGILSTSPNLDTSQFEGRNPGFGANAADLVGRGGFTTNQPLPVPPELANVPDGTEVRQRGENGATGRLYVKRGNVLVPIE